jgi:hypothetical protein
LGATGCHALSAEHATVHPTMVLVGENEEKYNPGIEVMKKIKKKQIRRQKTKRRMIKMLLR